MTLPETYDEAMRRITNQEPEHRAIALKALAWVSYAFRSLSLRELQHALAIEPGVVELDEELMIEGNNLISLCAGLIVIDQVSMRIYHVCLGIPWVFEVRGKCILTAD